MNSKIIKLKKRILLITSCIFVSHAIIAQTSLEDDVIVLKDGKEYVGQIIEQSPGKSIKFIENLKTDTLTFFIPQIDKLKKQPKKEIKSTNIQQTPIEININNNNNSSNSTINQIGNDLTIFSEMGYKFSLYINGKKYNESFSTNVVVENINYDWVKLAIIFEDPDKGIIEQNISLSPYNSNDLIPYSSTYRIVVNKKNKIVLSYYGANAKKVAGTSNIIINRNSAPPPGVRFQINHSTRVR